MSEFTIEIRERRQLNAPLDLKNGFSTYAKLPSCLCGAGICALFIDGGAPAPEVGGHPLAFCGFMEGVQGDETKRRILNGPIRISLDKKDILR